jgi:NAD(P)-dependent dehydrogenase (short-subunit alcohol dehydrogenase family)
MINNPFSLEGKTVFITGASSGIGESISIETSKMDANVIINGRDKDRLNQTFKQLNGNYNKQIVADLAKVDNIDNLAENLPNLDGLVLCAGMIKTLPAKSIVDSAILEIFQINLFSSIQLIRRLLKQKKINRGASIVLISSISTINAKAGNALYSATKGALNSYGKVLALELAAQRIRVNSIQPGFIKSRILDNGAITAEQIEENIKNYPLGVGTPSDIAFACIYLLSDSAKWVTGSVFTIDGGVTLKV